MTVENFEESFIEYIDSAGGPTGKGHKAHVWLSVRDYVALTAHAEVEVITSEPGDELVSVVIHRLPSSET